MDIIHTVVDWYMANLNYFSVMLLMTVESSFIPFLRSGCSLSRFRRGRGEAEYLFVVCSVPSARCWERL